MTIFCHETYHAVPLQTDAERAAIEDKFRLAKLEKKWHKSAKHNPENLGLFAYNRAKQSKRNPVASSDNKHIIQNGIEKVDR